MKVVSVIAMATIVACSTAAKRERANSIHSIHQLVPYNLHVRRPAVQGADPTVGPGGVDYQSNPLPSARFDCEPYAGLFSAVKLDALRSCIAGIKQPSIVSYRLIRDFAPYLAMREPETAPACLRAHLERIPVPREIFFQSAEEGKIGCYSARLEIEADEVMSAKVPIKKVALRVEFPLEKGPQSDEETRLLLLSWMLAPFWKNEPQELRSVIVPEAICGRCMGAQNLIKDIDPPPVHWP